jgi:hypothetical protein
MFKIQDKDITDEFGAQVIVNLPAAPGKVLTGTFTAIYAYPTLKEYKSDEALYKAQLQRIIETAKGNAEAEDQDQDQDLDQDQSDFAKKISTCETVDDLNKAYLDKVLIAVEGIELQGKVLSRDEGRDFVMNHERFSIATIPATLNAYHHGYRGAKRKNSKK